MQCILSGNQYFKILPTKSWRQFGPKNFHNNISLLNGLQLMINVTPRYLVIHHRAGTTKGLNVSLLSLLLVWGGWSHTVTTAKLSNHIYLTALLEVSQEEIPFWVRSGVWLWWHVHSLPKSSDTNKIFNTKIHQIDLKEWQDLRLTCSKIDVRVNTEWQNVSGQHTSWETYWGRVCSGCTGSGGGARTVQESCRCTAPCALGWESSACSEASSWCWARVIRGQERPTEF